MKKNKRYIGWLSVFALLLTTACTSLSELDAERMRTGEGSKTVTITVQPETATAGMRAATLNHISDGKKATILIYAVYKDNGNGSYELLETNDVTESKDEVTDNGITKGKGQTIIDFTKQEESIKLSIKEDENYKIAFWAQSEKAKDYYDTQNLEQVEVKYKDSNNNDFKNNDEARDAFCTVVQVNGSSSETTYKAILRRPLAQINVGTVGWDYEGAAHLKPSPVSYTDSKMIVYGAAKYYNVVAGKTVKKDELTGTDTEKEDTTTVVFEMSKIPAFINVTEDDWNNAEKKYEPFKDKEEFLEVDLDNDKNFKQYVGWEDSKSYREDPIEENRPATETFKYLSMCYVLVPEGTAPEGVSKNRDDGAVLPAVTFYAEGDPDTEETEQEDEPQGTDASSSDETTTTQKITKEFTIQNVPVHKNWRTNILGEGFFISSEKWILDIVSDYYGDWNETDSITGNWSGEEKKGKTYTISFNGSATESPKGFFTYGNLSYGSKVNGVDKYTGKYNGIDYTMGLKMNSSGTISFTPETTATVLIVQCTKQAGSDWAHTIKFDGEELPIESATTPENSTNVRLYTITNVKAGNTHTISKGSDETGIFYIEVQTETEFEVDEDKTKYPDSTAPDPDEKDNPDKNKGNSQGNN